VYDKGKGAVVVVATESKDPSGKVLFRGQSSIFVAARAASAGDRGPSGAKNAPPIASPTSRSRTRTLPQQALIYRLSGDMNPLHADPDFAKMGGFDVPIHCHGLCSFGASRRPRRAVRVLRTTTRRA
jgi:multifunctional beta-oxidation protein